MKAKVEPTWRFWGLYVHICKVETLREACRMAEKNNAAPGILGVTFKVIEERSRTPPLPSYIPCASPQPGPI